MTTLDELGRVARQAYPFRSPFLDLPAGRMHCGLEDRQTVWRV